MTEDITRYDQWNQVPAHLRTKTQLADLDLPRVPVSDPAAYVYERGPHGRKGSFYLYDATTSTPSPASARQLEAARARQDPAARVCADCGAHPDRAPALSIDPDDTDRDAIPRCGACLYITELRRRQRLTLQGRAHAASEAARWLAEDRAAVLHVAPMAPPPGENGRPKRPIALTVTVVTPSGASLAGMNVRLNASRNPLVPADAVPAAEALPTLRDRFADRDVIQWAVGSLKHISDALTGHSNYDQRHHVLITLDQKVAAWRAEIDPRTFRPVSSLDPGRADLMALLIRRMAATATTKGQDA